MKFLSIDIETSALEPENGDVLSFAAVLEDTENLVPVDELPSFYFVFKHDKIKGEPFALNMNKTLIEQISKNEEGFVSPQTPSIIFSIDF